MADPPGLLLALETATEHASAALLSGEVLLAERNAAGPRPHSTRLLPAVHALLEETGVALAELSGYAVSIGPGSFTGLRLAVATVRGLAFGDEREVAPVPTLAALAASALPNERPVLACLDARRGEVYAALFEGDGFTASPLVPEGVYRPEELASRWTRPCLLVGSAGEEAAVGAVAARLPGAERVPPAPLRAERVGRLGVRLLAAGRGVPPSRLVPRYVRRAEAEVRRTGRRLEGPGL